MLSSAQDKFQNPRISLHPSTLLTDMLEMSNFFGGKKEDFSKVASNFVERDGSQVYLVQDPASDRNSRIHAPTRSVTICT